jgi:hypothetical protein
MGRGGGKVPKRRGIISHQELVDGKIEHCISVTGMNFEHGPKPATRWPVGPPRFQPPSTRTEHEDKAPNPSTAGIFGQRPGDVVPHGQGYAFRWRLGGLEAWLDSRGYTGPLRRTARTIGVALESHGWEGVETCAYSPQAECGLTPSQWAEHGVTSAQVAGTLMDGMWDFGEVVALRPAAVFGP